MRRSDRGIHVLRRGEALEVRRVLAAVPVLALEAASQHSLLSSDSNVVASARRDINADGVPDLLIAGTQGIDRSEPFLKLFRSNETGSFDESLVATDTFDAVMLEDVDGDQRIDLVAQSVDSLFIWQAVAVEEPAIPGDEPSEPPPTDESAVEETDNEAPNEGQSVTGQPGEASEDPDADVTPETGSTNSDDAPDVLDVIVSSPEIEEDADEGFVAPETESSVGDTSEAETSVGKTPNELPSSESSPDLLSTGDEPIDPGGDSLPVDTPTAQEPVVDSTLGDNSPEASDAPTGEPINIESEQPPTEEADIAQPEVGDPSAETVLPETDAAVEVIPETETPTVEAGTSIDPDNIGDSATTDEEEVVESQARSVDGFAAPYSIPIEGMITGILDLSGDGRPEIVIQNSLAASVLALDESGAWSVTDEIVADLATDDELPFIDRFGLLDIDLDGDVDIVHVCRAGCQHVDHLMATLNDGDGRFDEHMTISPLPSGLLSGLTTESNTDGTPTIYVDYRPIGSGTSNIDVLMAGDGGAWSLTQSIAVSGVVEGLDVSDVDGNGSADLVVRSLIQTRRNATRQNAVFPRDADGQFGRSLPLPLGTKAPEIVGEGLYSLSDDGQYAALNTPEVVDFGTSLEVFPASLNTRAAAIIDINDDGLPDVIGPGLESLELMLADGKGGFVPATVELEGVSDIVFYTGQFDTTSGTDLVAAGTAETGDTVVVRIDTMQTPPTVRSVDVIPASIFIEQVDLDADGLDDFVLRSPFNAVERSAGVLLNRVDHWEFSELSDKSATVTIDDLDQDGTFEVYVFEDPIRIFKLREEGFQPWGEIPKGTNRAVVRDFNGDGLRDFLSIFRDSSNGTFLTVYSNNNDGTWSAWEAIEGNQHAIVDLNSDGLPDIATPRRVHLNTGQDGWSDSAEIVSDTPDWSERDRHVDVDGDGVLDVAKLHATTGILTLHEYQSDGSWHDIDPIRVGGFDFALLDLNSDGLADLLDTNDGALSVSYREGTGWSEEHVVAPSLVEYTIRDRNLDGLYDLIVVLDNEVRWYDQRTDGSFDAGEIIASGSVEIADIDDDGWEDLLFVGAETAWSTELTIQRGNELGFGEPELIPDPTLLSGIGSAEWNDSTLRVIQQDDSGTLGARLYLTSLLTGVGDIRLFEHALVDIDGDRDVDLVALTPSGVAVLAGVGTGDFDLNGRIEVADLELLQVAIREDREEDEGRFDQNNDGVVDRQDVAWWLDVVADTFEGDADLDGDVDFLDYLAFSRNFGRRDASWSSGDFDGDGVVSFPDFLVLSRQFGKKKSRASG